MDLKTENSSSNGLSPDVSLEKLHKMVEDLTLPGRFILRVLNAALEFITDLLGRLLGSRLDSQSTASPGPLLLLLHEDQTKASCLRANMVWRGYEVSQDVLILCMCCLLLVEELSVFGPCVVHAKPLQRSPGAPLRFIFLLCVLLLVLWMFLLLCLLAHFPSFPSQQLGGALGYLGWKVLYQGWYRLRPSWGCPGLPGEGLIISTHNQPHYC
ncbi:fat storage-inducing transmembrane protein 1-like protein [Lates japonicus]|uniref:Fat storage-inducing transmembrane protein 1-like protein n=1 Tax=Lates japonicus TaxID=270547 RepID=A0AAD3MKK2_LATJO|nr:fat storage-inducing transmembrane protein 1-like protein [Lates japonicus]